MQLGFCNQQVGFQKDICTSEPLGVHNQQQGSHPTRVPYNVHSMHVDTCNQYICPTSMKGSYRETSQLQLGHSTTWLLQGLGFRVYPWQDVQIL